MVRDPDVRHQLARAYRQGWSVYRRVLRTRAGDDALLEARQWEADHFEDVPVIIVACVRRPPARCSPPIGAASFYSGVFPAVQNLLLGAAALGLGGAASTLALWSRWEARRTLGLPASVTPSRSSRSGGPAASRPRLRSPRSEISCTSIGTATSHFGPAPGTDGRPGAPARRVAAA